MNIDPVRWLAPDNTVCSAWNDSFQADIIDGSLRIIDQTKLPVSLEYLVISDVKDTYSAIKTLAVRGAPAIGCAAALGLAAATRKHAGISDVPAFVAAVQKDSDYLASSRPTAVNLFWALNRCMDTLKKYAADGTDTSRLRRILLKEALDIVAEDIAMCDAIGRHGASLLRDGMGVLTHCNAGALATAGRGTALAPVYTAVEKGMKIKVFSDETRPLLQGSRLTAWELHRSDVDVTTICDNMAAQVMREGRIHAVIVGADRVAANGDTANKIGTYSVAIAAKYHSIPFYVAMPYSTIDSSLPDGSGIPIEQRSRQEITDFFGLRTAPSDVAVYNPAFDVTPHELIAAFITDKGVITPPFGGKILSAGQI